MAIAPVNKFISIMVPVTPGLQKLYEVPTGTSALVLYAQVANVGAATTYPTVTFFQRRESRSTGLTRDIRVIKDVEIPPNDGVILVDGRMVLEKTPLIVDEIFISGTQSGVSTITDVDYCEPLGIATITTIGNHGFSANDQITLGGIVFSCTNNNSGITTTIFPDPQASYTVDKINDTKQFTTIVGSSNGIIHTYKAAIHEFVKANKNSIHQQSTGTKFTPSSATYEPSTGSLVLTINNHGMTAGASSHTPNGAFYNGVAGILTVTTAAAHGFSSGDLIKFDDNALSFTCSMGSGTKTYPRSTDPASGTFKPITVESTTRFNMNVGISTIVTFTPTDAEYNGVAGILTCTIGSHSLLANTSVKIATESIKFTCSQDSHASIKSYPRASGCTGPNCVGGADPFYNKPVNITAVTDTTISLNVGQTSSGGIHTFSSATSGAIISGGDYDHTYVSAVTNGMKRSTEAIGIDTGSIYFTCSQDGFATEHAYPRATDPIVGIMTNFIESTTNTITVNVGPSTSGGLAAPLQMEFLASILENSNA